MSLDTHRAAIRTALEGIDLEQAARRLIREAIAEALPTQWERRAGVLESCRPRPGDYFGAATPDDLDALDHRCAVSAAQCRLHAAALRGDDVTSPEHAADVALVNGVSL